MYYITFLDLVYNNEFEKVKELVDNKMFCREVITLGLAEACHKNNYEMAKYLIEVGNARVQYLTHFFLFLCKRNYNEIVKLLLEKGLKIQPRWIHVCKNKEILDLLKQKN